MQCLMCSSAMKRAYDVVVPLRCKCPHEPKRKGASKMVMGEGPWEALGGSCWRSLRTGHFFEQGDVWNSTLLCRGKLLRRRIKFSLFQKSIREQPCFEHIWNEALYHFGKASRMKNQVLQAFL